jgi:vacuolar-type H+-ATPase subunit F/Vma7
MSVNALGDPYFVTALRAVGVDGRIVHTTKEAEDVVDLLVNTGNCKVIIVPYKLAQALERKRNELTRRGAYYPVFVIIPGIDGAIEERTNRLYQLISQAVGAKLKLGGD